MDQLKYKKKPVYEFIKRCFDIFISFVVLVAFSWFILLIGLLVIMTSKGPMFYGHKRIGKNGKTITIYKFRTMKYDTRPIQDQLTPAQYQEFIKTYKINNDPRITRLGNFLRKSSIDEIPQLWNILIGNMTIVGPRPILQEETLRYGENRSLLLKVKPGLTGYWAVHGRNETTYEKRIELELYYVTHRSIWLDIDIMFRTLLVVFNGKGAA